MCTSYGLGKMRWRRGLPWTLLTLLAGWWGIPWGPIYTIQSLVVNLKGGKDVTASLAAQLGLSAPQNMVGTVK